MMIILAALLGLIFGSIVNALVYRVHASMSMKGRSMCTACALPIRWYDLVPVASFLLLRGRCRRCGSLISWQYPLVETLTGACFALIAWDVAGFLLYSQQMAWFLYGAIFTTFLMILAVFDQKYGYVPDIFSIPAIGIALAANVALGVSGSSMFIGAGVIGGFFLVQYIVSGGRWIGSGDIRIGVFMGMLLGVSQGLFALFLAYCAGACLGLMLLIRRRVPRGTRVPFGAFLAAGTFVSLLWGEEMVRWYLGV